LIGLIGRPRWQGLVGLALNLGTPAGLLLVEYFFGTL